MDKLQEIKHALDKQNGSWAERDEQAEVERLDKANERLLIDIDDVAAPLKLENEQLRKALEEIYNKRVPVFYLEGQSMLQWIKDSREIARQALGIK